MNKKSQLDKIINNKAEIGLKYLQIFSAHKRLINF